MTNSNVRPVLREIAVAINNNTTLRKVAKACATTLATVAKPVTIVSENLYQGGMALRYVGDWGIVPNPEWYDHAYDLAFFARQRKPHFFERGVYASEVATGKEILDLCCGDGSVAALFVAPLAKRVHGVDFDPKAIDHAKRRWRSIENLTFDVCDIRSLNAEPASFDVVMWDAAIEHFTQQEMDSIIGGIKRVLRPNGLLHGSTIKRTEAAQHHEHEFEFESPGELKEFLSRWFANVLVFERDHPDRCSFYFRCSDQVDAALGQRP